MTHGGFTMVKQDGFLDCPMTVPCGQCIGCRLERSRVWAIRGVHESQMHDDNCFITLTYDDDNLPYNYGLDHTDFAKFMKRLRRKTGVKIRFLMCGEYGETTQRPHYHAIIFGWRPPDRSLFSVSGGNDLYESKFLSERWGLGHASFGEVTFESCAYVGRYITKKLTGDMAVDAYQVIDDETGEIFTRKAPYLVPSRDPPIGATWLEKYGRQAYEQDFVVLRAKEMGIPRAYDRFYERTDPQHFAAVERERKLRWAHKYAKPQHARRLGRKVHFKEIGNSRVPFDPGLTREEDRNIGRKQLAGEKIAMARLQSRSGIE